MTIPSNSVRAKVFFIIMGIFPFHQLNVGRITSSWIALRPRLQSLPHCSPAAFKALLLHAAFSTGKTKQAWRIHRQGAIHSADEAHRLHRAVPT
jgi:hypothetical protein